MEIKANKPDELNIELTIKVAAADYAEGEKKKLNERRRNAEFKDMMNKMKLIEDDIKGAAVDKSL